MGLDLRRAQDRRTIEEAVRSKENFLRGSLTRARNPAPTELPLLRPEDHAELGPIDTLTVNRIYVEDLDERGVLLNVVGARA